MSEPTRFWSKVDRSGGNSACWPWAGGKTGPGGYGRFRAGRPGRLVPAHRYAYELMIGPIPDGLCLDHLCRNRSCVNPAHLEPVTNRENLHRGIGHTATRAQQTTCINGHPFDDQNTYIKPNGCRSCRACKRRSDAAYYARARAARSRGTA